VAAIAGVPVQACRCSKPYPITECRHPRPRQSAMLRNLSVLGIRSPMIVPSRNALMRRRGRPSSRKVGRRIGSIIARQAMSFHAISNRWV
jgi:hypothetical protein